MNDSIIIEELIKKLKSNIIYSDDHVQAQYALSILLIITEMKARHAQSDQSHLKEVATPLAGS